MGFFYWKRRCLREGQVAKYAGHCVTAGEARRIIAAALGICISHAEEENARRHNRFHKKRPVNVVCLEECVARHETTSALGLTSGGRHSTQASAERIGFSTMTFRRIPDDDNAHVLPSATYLSVRIVPATRPYPLPPLLGAQTLPPPLPSRRDEDETTAFSEEKIA